MCKFGQNIPPVNRHLFRQVRDFQHFILTRFNVPFTRKWVGVARRPGWMAHRIDLFEKYCLPSVQAQTNQDFCWLIYLDRETSPEHLDRLKQLTDESAQIEFVFTSGGSDLDAANDISQRLKADAKQVLTTRLDNDDMLHREFVDDLHRQVHLCNAKIVMLNFAEGLGYRNGRVYRHRHASNAFISRLEPAGDMRTVLAQRHETWASSTPVFQLGDEPRWIQVLHEENLSNRVKGPQVSQKLLSGFIFSSTSLAEDSRLRILVHNILFYWLVWIREQAFVGLKKLAVNEYLPSLFTVSDRPGSLAGWLRNRRFQFFESKLNQIKGPVRILDVGGTPSFWENRGFHRREDVQLTILNREPATTQYSNMTVVSGDATDLSRYEDAEFDIVFSNSVIEHLETWENQCRMASEVARTGRYYFVQTPNRHFFLEPHFMLPFFQYLSKDVAYWILTNTWLSRLQRWEPGFARQYVDEIRLITRDEMTELFPGARLYDELILGLKKSFTAHNFE